MSWKKGSITSGSSVAHREFIDEITNFATKTFFAGAVTPGANTGDGLLVGQSATENSVAETLTVICTTGGSPATFSVTGSTSGALPDATTDTTYSESVASFLIFEGGVDFIIGDSFTFDTATGTAQWSANRLVNTPGADYEVLFEGIGYTGSDQIFTGLKSYDGNYGLKILGSTAYDPVPVFEAQPGASISYTPLLETGFDYWLFYTPQHIKAVVKSGATYTGFYIGYIDSIATASQWSYPLVSGGSSNSELRYTDADPDDISMFWLSSTENVEDTAKIRIFDGVEWLPRDFRGSHARNWPHQISGIPELANADGTVPMFPCTPIMYASSGTSTPDAETGRVMGELEGINHIGDASATVTPESILVESSKAYIAFSDTNNSDKSAAFELKED